MVYKSAFNVLWTRVLQSSSLWGVGWWDFKKQYEEYKAKYLGIYSIENIPCEYYYLEVVKLDTNALTLPTSKIFMIVLGRLVGNQYISSMRITAELHATHLMSDWDN